MPYALQFNTTTQQLQPVSVLPPDLSDQLHSGAGAALALAGVAGGEAEGAAIAGIETTPTSVHQVFVASRVAGTDAWNLKSAEGRYLGLVSSPSSAKSEDGAPALTAVNAQAEARGPNEAWFLERVVGLGGSCAGIALRSAAGGYLQLDEVAGGKVVVRADGTGPSAGECAWQVKVQWKHRHAARKEHLHAGPTLSGSGLKQAYDPAADLGSGAAALGKLNRSRLGLIGGKQVDISNRGLAKAAKEGRLAEEMLERRIKAKSDRYAKVSSGRFFQQKLTRRLPLTPVPCPLSQ